MTNVPPLKKGFLSRDFGIYVLPGHIFLATDIYFKHGPSLVYITVMHAPEHTVTASS